MPSSYIKRILNARVYEVVRETPIDPLPSLSKALHNRVLLKREDLQPIFSFKIRGAYNRIAALSEAERARGVVAASAGNHAQGVALAAARLGVEATIVMPVTTPQIKVRSVRDRGATVILHGDTFDAACAFARQVGSEAGQVFIHPYDDPEVIAGQGTVAMEIVRQHAGRLDAVFVPVGGGGLIAGVSVYLKYLRPAVRVIGVEAAESACLQAALAAGRRVTLPRVGIFADGVAVAQVGKAPFSLARRYVDEVITVSNDEICAAIKELFEDTRSIAEPAGALSAAGLRKYVQTNRVRGRTLLAINSGANVNFDRLRYISERTELGEHRELLLAVTIPERPGSLMALCRVLGGHDITEFNYRYADKSQAMVLLGVLLSSRPDAAARVQRQLRKSGYLPIDLSENELAKVHVCHMVGGRNAALQHERLFRFEFPERPGALMDLLSCLGDRWTISLFHYRQHGGAYGRVCMGFVVPPDDRPLFDASLKRLGYPFTEESDNPAYRLFLQ
jgi:threonine dehydratase